MCRERKLAARARAHVREARPRYRVERQRGLEIAGAFFAASRSGDMAALGAMLARDVSLHSDGGGKRPAAIVPVLGFGPVMQSADSLVYSTQPVTGTKFPYMTIRGTG